MEEQVLIESGGARMYGVLHRPERPGGVALVFCDPLFEERKSAHRALVEAARYLAARGFPVLRFDYRGCGDSPGDFREFSVGDWVADVRQALDFAKRAYPELGCGVLGLRAGAVLGLVAAVEAPEVSLALLWQPVVSGAEYFKEDLRKKLVKEMVTAGQQQTTRGGLLQELEEGREIDFDGYAVTPRLYRDLSALDLVDTARRFARRALVVQVSSSEMPAKPIGRILDALKEGGTRAEFEAACLPPFWNLVGYMDCRILFERTEAWLSAS
jgi:exosortase A-associated hydrolase 2